MLYECPIKPLRDEGEALEAWQGLRAGGTGQVVAEKRGAVTKRLAVTLIEAPEICRAVARRAAGAGAPEPGALAELVRLAGRVRVTPLIVLVETDPGAAALVARHAHAVARLLREQGAPPRRRPRWGFAAGDGAALAGLLWDVKWLAPALLERAGAGREHAEALLRHLHRPEALRRLREAGRAADALGEVVVDFCREKGVGAADEAGRQAVRRAVAETLVASAAAGSLRPDQTPAGLAARLQNLGPGTRARVTAAAEVVLSRERGAAQVPWELGGGPGGVKVDFDPGSGRLTVFCPRERAAPPPLVLLVPVEEGPPAVRAMAPAGPMLGREEDVARFEGVPDGRYLVVVLPGPERQLERE
jgi:hypothetical protein